MAIALAIFNDNGEIYCLGKDIKTVTETVQACTSKGKGMRIKLIKDTEKQLAYVAKALDTIGGNTHEQ
jgi:hypothetical protein